jgi:hypothetical protein
MFLEDETGERLDATMDCFRQGQPRQWSRATAAKLRIERLGIK